MNRTFSTLLKLTLLHDYYINGFTPDFSIIPTAATKHLLEKNRLLFKTTETGFLIGGDNLVMPVLPQLLAEKKLSFFLILKNACFMNFTGLPLRSGSKDIYYLNCALEGELQQPIETLALYPPVFTYSFTAAVNNPQIQVEDPKGNIHIDEILEGSAGQQLSISIDLKGYTSGLYRFIVQGQPDENIYILDERRGGGIFGIAEIVLPDFSGFDPDMYQASQYQFLFNARSSAWEYYLLFSRDYTGHTLIMDDTVGGNTFTVTETPPNYEEGNRIVFTSVDDIAYSEVSIKGIRLTISDGVVNRRYSNLSGPVIGNPESKIYLTI